ncbi:ABC transporter substrate-binding protein [Pokkaliibacter plantistimulans]|uniref:ABC transporter substrate-binding protein n=1 Tax=Proteobacteria bacterium 228 TaxID=2083153 RepID=A0A2S5KU42_9PROT|nr:ABC transporter substrate-binding protein [Pokkaliibacter plantistimulans]PPC78233.1 ABC transporter substrate-binding protein [Pokkaliibacter plantistimulans]
MKRLLLGAGIVLGSLLSVTSLPSLADDNPLKGNIRVVIGSKSTGGDTYQAASIVAEALSKKLDMNFKVDAVGETAAFKALERGQRGNTIMIFHDQSYLGYLYGQNGYEDIFATYKIGPTIAINPGNAFLVPKKSPYNTLEDVIDAAGNGKTVRVAIQPGGVSEIGYSAIKNAVKLKYPGKEDNVVALNTGSQADKNQQLFDGLADVINGSVQANEQYTRLPADDQKAMRFIWLTAKSTTLADAPEAGMGELNRAAMLKLAEPQVKVPLADGNNFAFDKEFFFLYNKDIDPKIVAFLDKSLGQIFADGAIQEEQKKAFFTPDFLPSAQAEAHLKAKMEEYKQVIDALHH